MIFLRCRFLFFVCVVVCCSELAFAEPVEISTPQLPLTSAQVQKLHQLLHVSKTPYQFSSTSKETSPEHIVWHQTPIALTLPIGIERMVHFSETVQVGYDKSLLNDEKIRIQNNGGTVYFLAKQRFSVERIQIKLENGRIILLDVSAEKGASAIPLAIVTTEDRSTHPSMPAVSQYPALEPQENAEEQDTHRMPSMPITPIRLTRFAVQQLKAASFQR